MAAGPSLDRIDLAILARLQDDARLTNQALAAAVGLSPSACLTRVRRLESGGLILGYHARLDIEAIRRAVTVFGEVTLKSHRPADLAVFEAALQEIPEIVEASQVSGPFDYLLKAVAPDIRSWGELADRLLRDELGVDKIASHILMKDAKPYRGVPLAPWPAFGEFREGGMRHTLRNRRVSPPQRRENIVTIYAHSLPGRTQDQWELLSHHLAAVGARACAFAEPFGGGQAARTAGLLHDIGKTSLAFQGYIRQPRDAPGAVRGPDHSTAGAREALKAYPNVLGRMLAFAIAGHHAGLADGGELDRRLREASIETYEGWRSHVGALPGPTDVRPARPFDLGPHAGFCQAFLTRMLFSCLVDADFLETETFYAKAEGRPVERGGHTSTAVLRDRLRGHMAAMRRTDTPVNALRARVLDHAVAQAEHAPGLFTLTVPTGGGKTLASLSFALEHAVRHGMKRVVYVIPFTSIIEQTAQVFRDALDTRDDVLEHHASFDWEQARSVAEADDEGPGGLAKLRKAAENWDAPVVVTTAVQFFESLFASRTSRCRKLHNLAGAVIVLDEAQSLPLHVLRPCLAALDELARNYGASVVLCTATQPAWRKIDGPPADPRRADWRLDIGKDRELAPDPEGLYAALKRVNVEVLEGPVADETVTARFAEQDRMLCIVNSRAHARTLFEAIRDLPGATHLTTLMCPRHRRAVLADVRARLKAGQPVRLVATSLIEAGVDVDFPEVWRAVAGIDSIAQAAGRCNREGKLAMGRTVVFEPAEARPPPALAAFWQAARQVVPDHDDLLSLPAIHAYFRELYWQKGDEALDAIEVDGRRGVLPALSERAEAFSFPFRSLGGAFRLIDDVMQPVIVPWDEEAKASLAAVAAADRPPAHHLRRLQQYVVSIPIRARDQWLALDALQPVHPALGDGLLMFSDKAHYREDIGLDLADLGLRSTELNVM